MKKIPVVTIVGRINTGKSTLFNTIIESKKAITSPIPGTTRDRNMEKVYWRGITFKIVDTGGIDIEELTNSFQMLAEKKSPKDFKEPDTIEKGIVLQTYQGIAEADLMVFLVDGQAGLMHHDRDLAKILHNSKKKVIVVCNKMDSLKMYYKLGEFYSLGFGDPIPVSAASGSGVGDLLDEIVTNLKKIKKNLRQSKWSKEKSISVSLIGKPNVGKSSLINALTGEARSIVSPIPMTTREPQDISIEYKKKIITFIDTAGLKRKAKIDPGIDMLANIKSLDTIARSDIILYVVDVLDINNSLDVRISGLLAKSLASVIIVANKWDLVPNKNPLTDPQYQKAIYHYLHPLSWAPIILISAKSGQNVKKILDLLLEVFERRNITLSSKALNAFLKRLIKKKRPIGGTDTEKPRIIKIRQLKTNPPEFTLYLGNNQDLHYSYYRFIENSLRKEFGLEGVNVKIDTQKP